MNKFFRFCILAFKGISYLLGVLVILSLIIYFVAPIYLNYKASNDHVDCINKNEPDLYKNLLQCWQMHDIPSINLLIRPHLDSPQESEQLKVWLRGHLIEVDSLKNEDFYLGVLNQLVPMENDKQSYAERESDRAYLKNVVATNSVNKDWAIIVLGYYKDDEDIPVFHAGMKSSVDEEVVFSIESLINNCSPKAREALVGALNLPNVKKYLDKNQPEGILNNAIKARCPINVNTMRSDSK